MRILSIDCGLKTLGYCLYQPEPSKILEWGTADVQATGDSPAAITIALWRYFDAMPELLDGDDNTAMTVVIERQPPRNGKMKAVEMALTAYFVAHGVLGREAAGRPPIKVVSYSPRHKLGGAVRGRSAAKYRERKALSVERCLALPEVQQGWLDKLQAMPKQDDACDALLMAMAYTREARPEPRQVLARKPGPGTTDLSQAHVKWLLKRHLFPRARAARRTARDTLPQYVTDTPGLADAIEQHYGTLAETLHQLHL